MPTATMTKKISIFSVLADRLVPIDVEISSQTLLTMEIWPRQQNDEILFPQQQQH
jgi:hypothetical protein